MRVLSSEENGFPSPEAWDDLVAASPHGHLLQSWAWGDLKGRFGWQPVRLAVSDGGRLLAGAQVLLRRLPYRCLAYVPRGPVLHPEDEHANRLLLAALHDAARSHRALALKVEPATPHDPEAARWWQAQGFAGGARAIQPRSTIVVDLRPSEEAILAQMNPKSRYAIRTALRREVTVRRGGTADVPVFIDLLRETSRRQGFQVHTPEYYEAAYRLFEPAGRVALLLAYYQDEPLAGLMALAFGPQAIYMFGASSERERARNPNHLLQWEAMRWAKARGCAGYDLWGISDGEPSAPGADLKGVTHFKAGFGGAQATSAGAFDYAYSPLVYRAFNWAWQRRSQRANNKGKGSLEQQGQ
ncbi:MAG TPA: peptidoglycan bridge formation glycyltransferase FemA/FemB family protein [Anaerolineae bacterium]|nr:peptidoglycan bridge formation glycyltransferase FemA/FemB family protein [Anaerolineae bacterium]